MNMDDFSEEELDRIIGGEAPESVMASRKREKPTERGEGLGQVERAQLKRMAETGDESYGEGTMGAVRSIGEMVVPFVHGNMVRVNANRAKARQGFIDGSTYNDGYRKFGGDTSVDERFAGDEPKGTSFWADLTQGVSDQAEALPVVGGLLRKGREAFNGATESSFFEHLVNEARQTGLSYDDIDEAIRQSKGDPRKFQNVFGRMVFEDERHADEVKKSAKRKLAANPEDWVDKIVQGFIDNAGYTGGFFAGGVLAKGVKAGVKGEKLLKFAAQNAIPAASSAATRKAELESDEYTFDENGNRVLVSKGDENALGKAVRGGIAEAAVETGTDAVVDWLLGRVPGANALGKAVMRNLRKTEVGKAVANGLKTYRTYAGVTGLNGAPVEVLEEDVQGFIDNVMGWDRKDSEYEGASKEWTKFRNETLTAEGQLDTFLGLLGTMAVQGGAALHKAQYQLANDKRDTRTALKTALPGMEDAIDGYSGDQLRFLKHLLTKTEAVDGVRDGSGRNARQTRYALNGDNIAKLFDQISSRYGERAREGMQQVVDDLMANDNTPQWVKGIDERADAQFTIPQNGDGQVLWNVGEDGKKFMTDPRTGISVTEKFSDGDNVMYEISDGKGHFAGADSVQSAFDAANAMAKYRATLEAQRDAKAQILEGMKKGIGRGLNVVAADDMDSLLFEHPELKEDSGFNPLNESVVLKDGTVVMVLDNIDTPMKMEQKLLHEAGVHMGLRLTHPKDKLDFIRQIAPKDANKMVKAVAEAYGTTADKVLKDPRLLEEVVAHTVERSMRSQGFRQKAVALARNAVRKAGIDVDYSDAEMAGIVESMVAATNEGDGSFTRWRGLTPDDREEAARLQSELDAEDPEAERRANAALGEAVQKGADEERSAGRKEDFNAAVDEELENEEIAANMDEGEFAHPQRTAPDPVSRKEAARNRERERRAKRIARANAAIGREARPNVPDPELEAEDAKKKVRITVGTDTSGENADYNGHTVNVRPYASGGKEKGRIITLPDGSQLFAQGAKSTSDALKQMGATLERRLPRKTPKITKSERKPSRNGTSVNWGAPDFVDWVRKTKKRNPRYEDIEEYENFRGFVHKCGCVGG